VRVRGVDDALCDGGQSYSIAFHASSDDVDFDDLRDPGIPAFNLDDEPEDCPRPAGDPGTVVAQVASSFDHSEIAVDGQGRMYEAVTRPGPPYVLVYDAFGGNAPPSPILESALDDLPQLGEDSVTNDQLGFVYVAQSFRGDLELGPYPLSAGTGEALYLAKFHPSGQIMQVKQLGAPLLDPSALTRIQAGPYGSVLLVQPDTWTLLDASFELIWTAPAFRSDVRKLHDSDSWVVVDDFDATYYWEDTVVYRIGRDGTSEPLVDVGSYGGDEITGIASSSAATLYVAGDFTGALAVGLDSFESSVPQAFVASFDENGRPRWATLPAGDTRLEQVASTLNGQVYVAGDKRGTGPDFPWPQYLEKLDLFGRSQWINQDWPADPAHGTGQDRALLAVHPEGQVVAMAEVHPGDLESGTIFKFMP
jgi:hypothetical protein